MLGFGDSAHEGSLHLSLQVLNCIVFWYKMSRAWGCVVEHPLGCGLLAGRALTADVSLDHTPEQLRFGYDKAEEYLSVFHIARDW